MMTGPWYLFTNCQVWLLSGCVETPLTDNNTVEGTPHNQPHTTLIVQQANYTCNILTGMQCTYGKGHILTKEEVALSGAIAANCKSMKIEVINWTAPMLRTVLLHRQKDL